MGYKRKRRNTILAQSKEISEQHRVHKALGIMDRKISQMILPGILQNSGPENLQKIGHEQCAKVCNIN